MPVGHYRFLPHVLSSPLFSVSFDACVIWDTENVDVKTNDKVKQEPGLATSILTITVLFVVCVGAAPVIVESQRPLCKGLLC